ncbi:MAG: Trk system potassium transporter TrkA [Eubacteriales bacterium]|jgi:trk system potassium uptake protein TrkA
MRIVIVGDGKVGRALIEQLSKEGHNVVIIDSSSRVIDESVNSMDVMGVIGNGASYSVQMEAGVDRADLLIAATSSDELNILCCLVAKKIGAKSTIARVRNPDYSSQLSFLRDELGLSLVINPELSAANEISRILRFPSALKVETFSRGRTELVELKVTAESKLEDTALYELEKKYRIKILICAVQRGEEVFIPGGDFILRSGDRIHITGDQSEINAFVKAVGISREKIRSVMVIGGGRIAYYLARMMTGTGARVKIVELDEGTCVKLSEGLKNVDIICGDGTDHQLLIEEGIGETDAVVALTGIDEENILIALYANSINVNKTIAKVNRNSLFGIADNLGLESIISPKDITVDYILRYVRAMQNTMGSNVLTLYRIVENKAEALEFRVDKKAECVGVPLKELKLKPNLLIASIMRGDSHIIPRGDDTIEADDRVIVITKNHRLRDLDDILLRK